MMRKPTYKDKLDRERAALEAAGLVSERYAEISSIQFRMTYFQRGMQHILMKRTLSFAPSDHAGFHLKCMNDGCENGGYDLAAVVAAMVKGRKRSTSGKLPCRGTSGTPGHASIAYEVNITYS